MPFGILMPETYRYGGRGVRVLKRAPLDVSWGLRGECCRPRPEHQYVMFASLAGWPINTHLIPVGILAVTVVQSLSE